MRVMYIKEMFYANEWYDVAIKSGLQGLFTGTISGLMWGFDAGVAKPDHRQMNLFVYTAMTGAVASLLSDVVHKIAHKELPVSKKNKDLASQTLGLITSGAVYVGALALYEPVSAADMGYLTCFGLGGLSEYLATLSASMLSEIYE